MGAGSRLREAREHLGFSVAQVAQQLNLDASVIAALESGDYATLGAPVFVRGHLRRYAELLGESPDEIQEQWSAAADGTAEPDLTQVARAMPLADPRRYLLPAVLLAGALVLAAIVWWALQAQPAPVS